MAVRMQAGATFVADQTVIPEAQGNQPQIVLLPDSREMDCPPPPYDQTVNPEAQDNQTQIVLLLDSREMDGPPPPYGAVTEADYQTLQVRMPPSYEEAVHGQ